MISRVFIASIFFVFSSLQAGTSFAESSNVMIAGGSVPHLTRTTNNKIYQFGFIAGYYTGDYNFTECSKVAGTLLAHYKSNQTSAPVFVEQRRFELPSDRVAILGVFENTSNTWAWQCVKLVGGTDMWVIDNNGQKIYSSEFDGWRHMNYRMSGYRMGIQYVPTHGYLAYGFHFALWVD